MGTASNVYVSDDQRAPEAPGAPGAGIAASEVVSKGVAACADGFATAEERPCQEDLSEKVVRR